MTKEEIIKKLRDMAKYPTVTLPRDCEALKAAADLLAQPEQEPVAAVESVATVVSESGNQEVTMSWWHEPALPVGTNLYTTPPHRKPLTSGEIYTAYITATNQTLRAQDERLAFAFARAIEAAHGIKENT